MTMSKIEEERCCDGVRRDEEEEEKESLGGCSVRHYCCPTLMELDRGFDEFLIRGGEEEWRSLSGGFDWMVVVAACLLAEGEGEALWFVRVLPAARHKSYRTRWFGFDLMMSGRRSPELVVGDEGE
ncbi:hypothetical protein HAX54_025074 [Datura stramonium]|uniref:Uncharacterized protein n=1 Tax=Datura stramonium TaxID=4076 RepID=A0ABS8UZN5_DATST|nr:hypothetical protein [Datura stramonium]